MVDEKEILEVRTAYYEKLSNEEFTWNEDSIKVVDGSRVKGRANL